MRPQPSKDQVAAPTAIPSPETTALAYTRRVLIEDLRAEISDPALAKNLSFLLESFTDEDIRDLSERLLRPSTQADPPNLAHLLIDIQRRRVLAAKVAGKPTIAFYYPTSAYRSNVGCLPARLREDGNTVLTLLGEVCHDAYEAQPPVFFAGNVGGREISWELDGIDMFIFPHIAWDLPADAKRVYFPHDMHDAVDWTIVRAEGRIDQAVLRRIILSIDYIVIPLTYDMPRVAQLVSACKAQYRITKPFVLIPGGYVKLDRNLEYLQTHPQAAHSIIYATTMGGHVRRDLPTCHAQETIEAILEAFPERELIFRPHPHTLSWLGVRNIVDRFRDHPRLVFDSAASFYMDQYARSAVMVTDVSGTAYTFAFSTLRPAIFYTPPFLFGPASRHQHFRFFQDRARIGAVVESIPQLLREIRNALDGAGPTPDAIRAYRDSVVHHLGGAEEYFRANYRYILSGEKHPDWIYL